MSWNIRSLRLVLLLVALSVNLTGVLIHSVPILIVSALMFLIYYATKPE